MQDENVAVHLVRNSLGGNHHELLAGRLAFSSPFSRNLRDDITVQVIFFNVPDLKISTQKLTLLNRGKALILRPTQTHLKARTSLARVDAPDLLRTKI